MCDLKLCIGGTASLLPRETFTFGTSEKAGNTSNTATRYEIYPSIKSIKIDTSIRIIARRIVIFIKSIPFT